MFAITNVGMLAGGVLFEILTDKFGRVRFFTYSIFLFAIGTALTVFAINTEQVYAYRFIAGLDAGEVNGIGMALVAEAWPKNKQGRAPSFVSLGAQNGVILAALLSVFILPILLAIPCTHLKRESSRLFQIKRYYLI